MTAPLLLLDLDGTLTDSYPGIASSVVHAFTAAGLTVPTPAELRSFVGPPLHDALVARGFSPTQSGELVAHYRTAYGAGGMFENSVFPGVLDALRALRQAGAALLVATSKPEVYAVPICEHLGIAPLVDGIFGASLEASTATKAAVVARALTGRDDTEARLMVGDRSHDVHGARANGVDCVGVAWGYAEPGELEDAGAVEVVATPADLVASATRRLGLA
ncbi:HAD hydrolase-like protein [Cellulomonas edaphi]|uniref:HAD hydrolase-like protein n=1 Tax=Cellulomonas edaphi TaxID=3053468 RepID=A0ABT7SAS8_9CELL|nr:HAD hydrolase-like protein [Cellulomons edaphi]MDM7832671.1 HAD hydrolase-like protein [Cellulomons edaphi]